MHPSLHAQLGQSEDDIFDESPMQVDEPADHLANSSTPLSPTPPPKRPIGSIPDEAILEACQNLERNVSPGDDDARILVNLKTVWFLVHMALSQNPTLSGCLANLNEFRVNVKREGEQQFVGFLRKTARDKSWQDLFENKVFFKQNSGRY
ncbi:hypothetical protein BJV78DRAFT_682468 [Lactifluus subvellereus]|nr:hypothetical protein BJV78DRAFT_682468 [Lactifluus subvellereus]